MKTGAPSKTKKFFNLIAWQKAYALGLKIYTLSDTFPKNERYGLTSQIRRAVVSVSSNIAEGFGRESQKEKVRFYTIAKSSLSEVESQILFAKGLNYINKQQLTILLAEIDETHKVIFGLIRSIRNA